MKRNFFLALIGIALLAGAGGWYLWQTPVTEGKSFQQKGTLLINNPGFKTGVWYLSYEIPGSPGLSAELSFDTESLCSTDDGPSPCDLTAGWHGKMVEVQGVMKGKRVLVRSMSLQIETGTLVQLYYYNPTLDQGPGGTQCSKKGLVAVERILPSPDNLEAQTISLLLRGELSEEERAQGIETEWPLQGVVLASASLKDGVLTLNFKDPLNKTSGGSCRASLLWAQIEATAKQFSEVTTVKFLPEGLFQP